MSNPIQEIVCCMGQPVAGNPTQYMMEQAFSAAGLDWRCLTLEVPPESLGDAVRGLKAMGFRGGNFAVPHKVAVVEHLDGLSEAAELMGAVNCVHHGGDDRLIGENTEGKGFVQALRGVSDPAGKNVVVLGAGGAARAIAVEMALAGAARVTIINRSPEPGRLLAGLINDKIQTPADFAAWEGDYTVPEQTDVLIHATPIGLGDAEARVPLDVASLRPEMVVADVTYNPPATRLIRDATQRGCVTLDGLGMLVHQAAIGFKIWTGVEPDAEVMRESLEEFLGW